MKVSYDSEVDVLRIRLTSSEIEESDEVEPGFIVDLDKSGKVVGIEVLNASHSVENLPTLEVANMRATPVAA